MFCSNCGNIIEDNANFCAKCGTKVNISTIPDTPPTARSFDGVTPEQIKTNITEGQIAQANDEIHASQSEPVKTPNLQSTPIFSNNVSPSIGYSCPNCGKEIPHFNINYDNGTAFCSCRYNGLLASFKPFQQKPNPKKKFPIKIIAIVGAVILILAGVVLYFSLFAGNNDYTADYKNQPPVDALPQSAGVDIYAAGSVENTAVYWKNGDLVRLQGTSESGETFASGIYVSGKDVYVCGSVGGKAAYWKNGELLIFPEQVTAYSHFPPKIYGKDNDVYVSGYSDRNNTGYWKNGKLVKITNNIAIPTSICVSGNDVYVSYDVSIIDDERKLIGRIPGYSKNEYKIAMFMGPDNIDLGKEFRTHSICVEGNDVYVAGSIDGNVVLWKNQISTIYAYAENGWAKSVYVSGNDVYVAAFVDGLAVYWKNNVKYELETIPNAVLQSAESIYVLGEDVFVGGLSHGVVNDTARSSSVLWKNGKIIFAESVERNSQINDVFAVKKSGL
jgi:hypothetical protein